MVQYIIVMKIRYFTEKLNLFEALLAMRVRMSQIYARHLKRRLMTIKTCVKRRVKSQKCPSREVLMFVQELICIEELRCLPDIKGRISIKSLLMHWRNIYLLSKALNQLMKPDGPEETTLW